MGDLVRIKIKCRKHRRQSIAMLHRVRLSITDDDTVQWFNSLSTPAKVIFNGDPPPLKDEGGNPIADPLTIPANSYSSVYHLVDATADDSFNYELQSAICTFQEDIIEEKDRLSGNGPQIIIDA